MFGFGKNQKVPKPTDLMKSTKECLAGMEKCSIGSKQLEKLNEEMGKNVLGMKLIMLGETEDPSGENQAQLANEIYASDVVPQVVTQLAKLDFETKKDFVLLFNSLMRRKVGNREPTTEYLQKNPDIIEALFNGYEYGDVAMTVGGLLRESIKSETILKIVFASPSFWKIFKFVEYANFDVASDSFQSFKDIMLKHKNATAEFLDKYYDQFFQSYLTLLNSDNYVTRRQSLKLLSDILIERSNFKIMSKFIADSSNLKLSMTLLRDKSRNIQLEAFHVFKLFVANPSKPPTILHIFHKNKDKLISFLNGFHNDKEDDQFSEEKQFLIKQLQNLPPDPQQQQS